MQPRNRFKQSTSLYQRLNDEALRLRDQAKGIQPGSEREELIHKARQAEAASQMSEWLAPANAPTSSKG